VKLLKIIEYFIGGLVFLVVLNTFLSPPIRLVRGALHWDNPSWSESEISALKSLWIGSLPPLPADPSNAYSTDERAAALGHKIFFDPRFSKGGRVSCSTCHIPELAFTDGRALAFGTNIHTRNTPTILGSAYSPWFFHDGRADSQWAQVLATMENDVEHGGSRGQYSHVVAEFYKDEYEAIFGALPDLSDLERFPLRAGPVEEEKAAAGWQKMTPEDQEILTQIYVNLAKSVAAYQRQIVPGPSRFDRYVAALLNGAEADRKEALSADEVAGARIFIGKGECILCHNGPLLTNNTFHNTAAPGAGAAEGRAAVIDQLLENEFNCLGTYSDASPEHDCTELKFIKTTGHELISAFRTPTLRSLARTAPYFHAGQFATLADLLHFYNEPPEAAEGHSELRPLGLTKRELKQLEAFLLALDSPTAVPAELLASPFQ
jgi:cytochrome c peroxidase